MILYINTTEGHDVELMLKDKNRTVAKNKFAAEYSQAEKLLPALKEMLRKIGLKLTDIKEIRVVNKGGGFTALRVGVVTANALGYALRIPVIGSKKESIDFSGFKAVKPFYNKEPNITIER